MRKFFIATLKLLAAFLLLFVIVFTAGVLWPLSSPTPPARPDAVLIKNSTLVDIETGQLKPGIDILLMGDRIVKVGASLTQEGAKQIDAAGKFVIPGLFDMHMHSFKLSPELMHPLFVANGVTAVRDMGGCMNEDDAWAACASDKRAWTTAAAQGKHVGPRYDHITGLAMNGGLAMPTHLDEGLGGATPEGARERARIDKARGMDFLKPYTMIPKDSFMALADEARKQNMYLAGHLPLEVSAIEATQAGQRSVEHALVFLFECFPGMDALRKAPDFWALYDNALRTRMMVEHDPTLCQSVFDAMRDGGMAFVPTHTTRKLDAYAADPQYRNDQRLSLVPTPLRTMWNQDADAMARRGADDKGATYRAVYDFGLKLTGEAHKAGVQVMAGTDAPDSFTFAGSSLADELEHLTLAGLTPLEALRAATVVPAAFLGLEGEAGIVAPGARADLVLLNINPLADIGAVRDIHMVVLAGVPYDRASLDDLISGVEVAANSWSLWPKFAWQIANSPIMRRQFGD